MKSIVGFYNKSRPRGMEGKDKKRDAYESAYSAYEGRELTLNVFRSGIFLTKATKGEGLKIYPIALAQVKAGNRSGNLLNEIRQIIYSLYRAKVITNKYKTT